jgi:6-phosphogluconolactonase
MLHIYPDLEALSRAAAEFFVRQGREAILARGRFSVALSGGQTPRRTYELLSQAPWRDGVAWDRVHIFWGDERCVPLDDPLSNARMAREAWLEHVPLPPGQIHPINCSRAPEEAALQYEDLLRRFGGGRLPSLDLVWLGLGDNGHTASLFPGTPALNERQRGAVPVYVNEQNQFRVTLTAPFINQAAMVVFLVAGGEKRRFCKKCCKVPGTPNVYPPNSFSLPMAPCTGWWTRKPPPSCARKNYRRLRQYRSCQSSFLNFPLPFLGRIKVRGEKR